jgi:hypothetical protein
LQSFLLQIDVAEIIVNKANQPDTVIDLFDAYRLTSQRSAEIYFLFENADSSAAGNQNSPIMERIGKFSDAVIGARGSPPASPESRVILFSQAMGLWFVNDLKGYDLFGRVELDGKSSVKRL